MAAQQPPSDALAAAFQVETTEALQKVTREIKAISADKYDITAQGGSRGQGLYLNVEAGLL